MTDSRALPLKGIRVIEIAQNLAGPYCAEILAHLGADVIKVERIDGGDDTRGWGPPFLEGAGTSFHAVNLGKRSVAVDLKNPAQVARLLRLVDEADVLVQNLRPGSMDALGLDAATLAARNPKLVYCSLWALGSVGPLKDRPGFEPMVQAFSGLMMLSGQQDGPPIRMGTQVLDHGTGMWAAIGVLAALLRRSLTGRGGVVDTSLRGGQRSPLRQARGRAGPRGLGQGPALRAQCRALRASRGDTCRGGAHRGDPQQGRMGRRPAIRGRALLAGQYAARDAGRTAD